MTRKHFVDLAVALHSIRPKGIDCLPAGEILLGTKNEAIVRFEEWFEAVGAVADTCEASNERFNRCLFISVCENGV